MPETVNTISNPTAERTFTSVLLERYWFGLCAIMYANSGCCRLQINPVLIE